MQRFFKLQIYEGFMNNLNDKETKEVYGGVDFYQDVLYPLGGVVTVLSGYSLIAFVAWKLGQQERRER